MLIPPWKSPKILNPASKYQDHLPNPHFSGGELSVKLQGCILQPHIHATRTHHFFFECSWSCDRSGDRELQRCCCFFWRERLSFSFFRKFPYNHHMFYHFFIFSAWLFEGRWSIEMLKKKNYVTIKKAPKRSLWSKSPSKPSSRFLFFKRRNKKVTLNLIDERICAKKVHRLGYQKTRSGTKKVWVPSPGRGRKISAASVVHQSCCNGSGVSRFLGCVLLTPPWSLCLARKSMEIVSTCNTEPSRKTRSTKKTRFFVFASIWSFVHLLKRHMFQAR